MAERLIGAKEDAVAFTELEKLVEWRGTWDKGVPFFFCSLLRAHVTYGRAVGESSMDQRPWTGGPEHLPS